MTATTQSDSSSASLSFSRPACRARRAVLAKQLIRVLSWLLAPVSCLLFLGCGPTPAERQAERAVTDYFMGNYPSAENLLRPLAAKTNEDFVLNNVRLGSVALANYDLDTAESAFLRAYEVINSFGVNNGGRSLGAAVVDERIKVWKGEPYERAMVNFYLGLIYYMRGDYGNARAAFENALFKLRDYGEETKDGKKSTDSYREVETNFALAYLMLGRCYQRLNREDEAHKAFARAVDLRPDLEADADYRRNDESNLLLVVDFGFGPRKTTSGDGALVGFRPTPREQGPIPTPMVLVDGQMMNVAGVARPPVDLLALAQDRRWQSIDTIRAVKSAVGTGMIIGGAAYGAMEHNPNPWVTLGLIAGGIALKATSQADVRQWEMLPRTVFLVPLRLPPGRHDISVQFPAVPGLSQTWYGLEVPPNGEATYYYRMLRYNTGPFNWPPPAMTRPATATVQ